MKPWPKVRLGEVLTPTERGESIDAAKEYRLLGVRLDGQGPFLRETVMGTQTSATKLFRVAKGDFIYSRLFACRGAFGVITEELDGCYVSGEFPAFVPVPGKLDVEFLKYWFRLPSVIATVDADCSGSTPLTRNRFKENFFLALEIPLPPLAEQRRVVARIEELAAQIHDARTLRHQATEEAEALVNSTISAEIETAAKESDGQLNRLEDVCAMITDGAHNTPRYVESGVPLLTAKNVFWEKFDTANVRHISREEHEPIYRRCPVKRDDVLFINIGATTGTARKVDFDLEFSVKNVAMLRADPRKLNTDFLVYILRGPAVRDQIAARQAQTCQQFLALRDIRNLKAPVPPLAEQRRIVAELDALQAEVDALKRLQAETAAELAALLPALLDRAFKGEL